MNAKATHGSLTGITFGCQTQF